MAKKKKQPDELEELDKIYSDLTGGPATPQKKRPFALVMICIAAVLLLAIGFCVYSVLFGSLLDDHLTMGDVTIAGISLEGMTKRQAKEALRQTAYEETDMVVSVLDTSVTLTPADTAIDPNMDAAVNAAFRSGSTGMFDVTPYLGLDLAVVRAAADTLGQQYNKDLKQTLCSVEGEAPSLLLGDENDSLNSMTLVITLGTPAYGLDVEGLNQQILDAYSGYCFTVTGQCTIIDPEMPDLDALYAQHAIAPVDAVMDMKTFDITPETYGYGFDLESAKEQLASAEYGQTLSFPFERITPEVTLESLKAILYRDVLGSCKTPYSGSDNNNRNTNLNLACQAINGKIVYPGETFTYNYTLGERTAERGYKPAASYVNGKTVDTYGGGICQVSSTLYYCTLIADLEIVERWPHGYISSYIDPGMDASVSWNSGDFRFKNNTNYPIRIEASRKDGYVYVQLVGTDEKDYYVKMSYKTLSSTKYETVYEDIKEEDNKHGYKDGQVLVTPYTGYKVNSYKNKYSKATDELISSELEATSNYSKRDKVVVRIIKPEEPTTTEAVPESTS